MAALDPIRRRIANLVARAVLTLVSDATTLQTVQVSVLDSEIRDGAERVQDYGFTSVPFPGAEGVVLFVGGLRDHPLVIRADDRRYRKKNLQPGEAAIYTDEGDYILLKRGRIVEVVAGTKVRVQAPLVECTGNMTITGTLQVTGASTLTGGATIGGIGFGSHKHTGVQAGGSQTGGPVA